MIYAELIEKKPWHEGLFPDDGKPYRTRQIVFKTDTGDHIHINVSEKHSGSMKFNELKVGDKICEFNTLKDKQIIHPDSKFKLYHKNALF